MVEVARTLYAKSGDLHVAYQLIGVGPPDLLSYSYFPIDMLDEEPSMSRFRRRLASFCRLVGFNPRGLGISDPVSPSSNPPTLEQWNQDALAIMDNVGIERAALFSGGWTAMEAVTLAVTFPSRVSHLIILNGSARWAWAPDYPAGQRREEIEAYDQVIFESDAVERGFDVVAVANPSVANDSVYREWWDRAGNRGASPAMARAVSRLRSEADVRPLLGSIQAPTLVLHRRDIAAAPFTVRHGRYLAEHIPDARFVELEGVDLSYWLGDTSGILDEIEEFLTGVRVGTEPDRALAAVLFTDIVSSTERIVAEGERRWRDLLDRHDAAIRRQLERFGGREIKTTGDGVLATFHGPARAVQCACAIRDAAAQLGLHVRAGIHFGEIELRGSDITGLAVVIAQRVQSHASPGEVLATRTVIDLVAGSRITYTARGEYELKGVPGVWQAFAITDA